MHLATITISLIGAALSAACLIAVAGGFGVGWAVVQLIVFFTVAGSAWTCRRSVGGSRVIFATSIVASALSFAVCYIASPGAAYGSGIIFLWCLWAQAIIAVAGCYIGYAILETQRLRPQNPNDASGKLLVSLLLAAGVLAILFLTAFR